MRELKIAVVGAGIFGITMALKLSRRGHRVDLFEKDRDILRGASGVNQFRLHRGYHYPRSVLTARGARDSLSSFREEYAGAVLEDFQHYYCIANDESLTSAYQYLAFCKDLQLEYQEASLDSFMKKDFVALCVEVKESLIDPEALRIICLEKLYQAGVNLHLGVEADETTIAAYDFEVIATYSNINRFLKDFPEAQRDYQFELCEKPVVRLPSLFDGKSIVILDGPFMCIDPFGRSGLFVLGNVVHAIHESNIGKFPDVDGRLAHLINNSVIPNPPVTQFDRFVASGVRFFPELKAAEHVGSMFTIRTVLPYREDTDERPTIVERVGERIITVFSGKLGTCVEAADRVVELIEER